MNDLRSEVVDILAKMKFFQGQRGGRELWNDKPFEVQEKDLESFNTGIETIRKYILQLEEQTKVNQWIPVEERLPEEDGMYLITSDVLGSKEIQCVLYQNMILHDFISSGKAVAWMPLPAPYDMRKKVEE